jgi:hypothetical protein
MSTPEDAVLNDEPITEPLPVAPFPVEPPVDPAEYLETQTLDGGDSYFHTENDEAHHSQQSPPTDLVTASQGGGTAAAGAAADDYESWTNADLMAELDRRGIEIPKPANKANLVAALRA